MESGGGGGGGGCSSFGYGNLQHKPHIYRPSPPLTAIDRFLWGQSNFSQQQTQNNVKNNERVVLPTSGAIGAAYGSEFLWANNQEASFVDGFFADGETLINWSHGRNQNVSTNEENKVATKSCKGTGKRAKKGSSAALIKGQWTDEEDR